MFKKLIKSFVAALTLASPMLAVSIVAAPIFAAPAFAADATGLFKGQGPSGPVQIQLRTNPQGYLTGKFQSTRGTFAVIAKQDGDKLTGWFGAPGEQPMPFTGSVKNDGTLTLTCGESSISLKSASAKSTTDAAATKTPASDQPGNDQLSRDMQQLADQAAQERAQRLAYLENLQRQRQAGQVYTAQANGNYGASQPTQSNPNYNYTPNNYAPYNYTPMSQPGYSAGNYTQPDYTQPNLNQPNDGSDLMARYEQQQAVDDQIALQRSDEMRGQNRYVGPDGNQYTAPIEATQVTVDQGGQATFSTEQAPTAPATETVAQPYNYSSGGATEEAGN